jgi:hypothetical protein
VTKETDMDDLGRKIKELVDDVVRDAVKDGRTTIASAVNVGQSGSVASAYSDDDISIVTVDGRTTVTRHARTASPASGDDATDAGSADA